LQNELEENEVFGSELGFFGQKASFIKK